MRRLFGCALLAVCCLTTPLSAKDFKNVVGVGWWGFPSGGYWFPSSLQWCLNASGIPYLVTTKTPCTASSTPYNDLAEGADRLLGVGSRVLYLPLNANPVAWYKWNNPQLTTTIFSHVASERLREIAKLPPYASVLTKNFDTFILAVGTNVPVCGDISATYNPDGSLNTPGHACDCSASCTEKKQFFGLEGLLGVRDYNWAPVMDGMTAAEYAAEKAAIKKLAVYLLQNPAFSGKTFVIADVEGDWALRTDHYGDEVWEPDASTVPSKTTRVNAMKSWYQARQAGVVEARDENMFSSVKVYNAAEVNKVEWAMQDPPTRMTVTNDVLNGLSGCCDLYTYSYWDGGGNPNTPEALTVRLDYLASKVPDTPPVWGPFGRFNVAVTEYGGGSSLYNGNLLSQRVTEAAVAWGCPWVVYWQLYDGLNVSVPLDQRATNSQTDASGLVRPDGTNTALRGYFASLSTKSFLRAGLRTSGGYYVSADDGGGGLIHVNAPWVKQWEEITIVDRNGGTLVSGDSVNLLTHTGNYVMAWDNGGGTTDATSEHDLAWEQFTILKLNGTGAINIGDTIALQTGSGHYFVAEGGGGGTNVLNANRTAIGPWEQFVLVYLP
jgi:hypothetical protein